MGVDFKVVGFQCLRIQGLQKLRQGSCTDLLAGVDGFSFAFGLGGLCILQSLPGWRVQVLKDSGVRV